MNWVLRVELWDAALAAVRATLRRAGLREVTTPVRVEAVALEPWIEPISTAGDRFLATSPELAMKRLLCRGSGSIFQIAHVFRAGEVGARHREEFHLIEWYREQGDLPMVMADVEAVVAAVAQAFEPFAARIALEIGARPSLGPVEWRRVKLLDRMGETLGCEFAGDESAEALNCHLERVRSELGCPLSPGDGRDAMDAPEEPELARLRAWTELFSLWSDRYLDPWLASLGPRAGVHVVDFPAPLAALAQREGSTAARFESHVGGVELANGYRELRDADEQRRRFERVAAMRAGDGLPPLPMPEAFLEELGGEPGLPPCCGVALGLDRLVALACGCERLDQVAVAP